MSEADYDAATLSVDPTTINDYYNVLNSQAQEVVSLLESVNSTLAALQLSWAGTTSDEVQQINDSWTSVMTQLFGTQDNPSAGVVNVILTGLLQVAAGYSQTEMSIYQMWLQFYMNLAGAGDASSTMPSSAPANQNDPNNTAVIEDFTT